MRAQARHLVGLALLLIAPATAHGRQVVVPIQPTSDEAFPHARVIEERVRVSVPAAGAVSNRYPARVWRNGRCWVSLRALATAERAPWLEKRGTFARFRLPDRYAAARFIYFIARAHRCARDRAGPIIRSARLDARRRPCDASGTTLAENTTLRVYAEQSDILVCARAARRRTFLGQAGGETWCFPDDCWVDHPAVGGRFVAFAEEMTSRYYGAGSDVRVVDGVTGRHLHRAAGGRPCSSDPQNASWIAALVVRADGAPAWIVRDCDTRTLEVRTLAGPVATGDGIDAGSLRVTGEAVRWVQDGAPRSAPF